MAITKNLLYDRKEIVSEYALLHVRKTLVIKEDNKEISRSFERYVLDPGTLKGGFKEDGTTPADDADDFVDNPLDKEPDGVTAIPQEIKDICAVIWTTSVKNAWKAKLIAKKPST
jgi:hypothetical protein